ncbi:MAG: hypothetical protein HYY40_08255 [Bacteroidetes bacterium]|nr:hypothetical protein [Bacteroidota bacterium]
MGLTPKQKDNLTKIFITLGSIIFGGVVIGYFVSDSKISTTAFFIGTIVVLICFYGALITDK